MNFRLIYVIILLLPFIAISCFEEDERVEPHIPGDVEIATIGLSQYYSNQVYFDLGTNMSVATNQKDDWDLAFEASEEGVLIRLNTSRFMVAGNSGETDFDAVTDTTGIKWKFDQSDGNPDSTALGAWIEIDGADTTFSRNVYVLDMGYDNIGNPKGFMKAIFYDIKGDTYSFRMAKLDGSGDQDYSVTKVPGYNFIQFSLKSGGETLFLEPLQNDWDLLFSQYTTLLYTNTGEPYPYIVTGVLLNPFKLRAAIDTIEDFESITKDIILDYEFSSRADIIGYEWKYYDFDAGSYTVDPTVVYFLRDTEGLFFKMRFVGFYNNMGEKGYPTIEFQQL